MTASTKSSAPTSDELFFLQQLADTGPLLNPAEAEMIGLPHLVQDLRHVQPRVACTYRERLQAKAASDLLQDLPGPRESVHLVISGRFALADLVPAVLLLAQPKKIRALHIATLGFSKDNITTLCRLLDEEQIRSLRLLCSHYFKHTSTPIYEYGKSELQKRKPAASFFSLRTHAKVIALELTDGRTVTIESSANLRTCKNIEQMTVLGDPGLYKFHRDWIDGLFIKAQTRKAHHGKEAKTKLQTRRRA